MEDNGLNRKSSHLVQSYPVVKSLRGRALEALEVGLHRYRKSLALARRHDSHEPVFALCVLICCRTFDGLVAGSLQTYLH